MCLIATMQKKRTVQSIARANIGVLSICVDFRIDNIPIIVAFNCQFFGFS